MNEEKDKALDDLFKRKLEDPVNQTGYHDRDWDALEQMLDNGKKRGIIYWLPVSSAAALLLLFLGWWAFRSHGTSNNYQNNQQAINQHKVHTGINGGSIRQQTNPSPKALTPAGIANNGKPGSAHKSFLPLSAAGSRPTTGLNKLPENDKVYHADEELAAANPVPVFEAEQIVVQPVNSTDLGNKPGAVSPVNGSKNEKIKSVSKRAYRPQFALSVLAAPDVNGVGSFQQAQVGTNEGLLFSAGISKKFTISTGAVYSVKPYITPFENYHTPYQFAVNPVSVSADCRMLDIPLDLGYQVYNKNQNKISVGTGLSSYIMLHESYTFNYANPYATGPAQFNVPGVNKYFFGVLNLNTTFQHQVNSKVGFSVQPYVKLPITNIGYSQVRLQTTGVAIGLTWNINSLSKP